MDWRERLELGIERRKKRGLERSTGNRIGVKEGEGIWKEGREKRIGVKDRNRDCSQGHECGLERRKGKRLQTKDG